MIELVPCPNCGELVVGLYGTWHGVLHCGCFYEKDPADTRHHFDDPIPPIEFDERCGVE